VLAGLCCAGLVATVGVTGASGSRGIAAPDLPGGGEPLSAAEALKQDTELLAGKYGLTAAQVAQRLDLQAAADGLRSSWSQQVLVDAYAGGIMDSSSDGPRAILYFKEAVPQVVRSQLADSGISGVELRGGQRYSWTELVARANALHDAVAALGFDEIVSTVDVATQRIVVELALRPDRPALRGTALREALVIPSTAADPDGRPVAVDTAGLATTGDIEIIERPAGTSLSRLHHGYGGASVRASGSFQCTSGFVVRRSSDWLEGVLTAAHCEGINQIDQNNSNGGLARDLTFSAPFQREHVGFYGDVEWHSTSHDDFPEFWSSGCCRRTVLNTISNLNIDVGDLVCKYGRKTGSDCGTVSKTHHSATFTWGACGCKVTAYNMVTVSDAVADVGDSGGPWFLGNTAWGVHHGATGFGSSADMVFSKIRNAENALGVFVQTG
jgi:hypothetical protein